MYFIPNFSYFYFCSFYNIAAFNLSHLIKSINLPCDSCASCEKCNLKIFTSYLYNSFIISTVDDDGHNVVMILVFLLKSKNSVNKSLFSLFSSFSDIYLFDSFFSLPFFKYFLPPFFQFDQQLLTFSNNISYKLFCFFSTHKIH